MPDDQDETSGTYLNVLVVCATPVDIKPTLNLAQEIADLEQEVRRSPIRLKRAVPPTFAQLRRELSPGALHVFQPKVFHFLGHGDGDGLWFEREDGSGEFIKAETLRAAFRGAGVRLLVFNACRTAGAGRAPSLSGKLIEDGSVAAAVGHNQPVADRSAIAFAKRFYEELTLGQPVGLACGRAASALAEGGLGGGADIVLEGDRQLRLADDLPRRPGLVDDGMPGRYFVPADRKFFCGRAAELLEVARTLADSDAVAFAVWGLGGLGKTALLREVARRNAWRYVAGGVAWVDVRDITPPRAVGLMGQALKQLDPAAVGDGPGDGLVACFTQRGPGLIVLDNLETLPESEHGHLARLVDRLPRNGSRVLLAARTPITPIEELSDERSRTLTTGLDEDDGAYYVEHVAWTRGINALQGEPLLCAQVSRRVSGHPLMIEWAVAVARKGRNVLEDALARLGGDLQSRLENLLATNLALVGAEGRRLLTYLPLFPTGRFLETAMVAACEAIARQAGGEGGGIEEGPPPDDEGAEDEPAPDDPETWVAAGIGELERAALLEFDQEANAYTFHPILLEHARRTGGLTPAMAAAGKGELLRFYRAYLRDHPERGPAFDRLLDDVVVLMESAWEGRAGAGPDDALLADLAGAIGLELARRKSRPVAERWNERAEQLRRHSPTAADISELAQLLFRKGVMLSGRDQVEETRRALTESIAIFERGGQSVAMRTPLLALAGLEADVGDLKAARDLLQKFYRGYDDVEYLKHPEFESMALHVRYEIAKREGNLDEARRHLKGAIDILERYGREDNPGRSRSPFANLLGLRSAIEFPEELAGTLATLVDLELGRGEQEEARCHVQKIRGIIEAHGYRHLLASNLHQRAGLAMMDGDLNEARRLFQQSLTLNQRDGKVHDQAANLLGLAVVEARMGDLDEARRLAERAAALLEKIGHGDATGARGLLEQIRHLQRSGGGPAKPGGEGAP